jgi:CspA family cold shock protein
VIGTVKFYDQQKGFGFIVPADGAKDVFVHASGLARGIAALLAGEEVEFETDIDRRDRRTIAVKVRPVASTVDTIRTMKELRKKIDKNLAGVTAANEPLADLRFLLDEIEQIAATVP